MKETPLQLGALVEAMAEVVGERTALVAGATRLTYAELDERTNRLANLLVAAGVGAGDHVAVHAPNCAEWVETFYACFKLGATPVNVNYRYLDAELRHVYDNADCVAAVVAPQNVDAVERLRPQLPKLRHVLAIDDRYERALADASPDRLDRALSGDDIYMLYTGGTTGMPKGVMWRNEDLIRGALNSARQGAPIESMSQLAADASERDANVLMAVGPMMHGGCQWSMGNTHLVGGCFVLYCEDSFDPRRVLEIASAERVASLSIIGDAMGKPLAEAMLGSSSSDLDLSALVVLANGAAPLTSAVKASLGDAFPGRFVVDSYGASETGATGSGMASTAGGPVRFTVGPETTVFALDLTRRARPGEVGLLARSGPIPLGYYKDPAKTAETFPTIDGRRWAVPGDQARLTDDGTIELLGRGSSSINSGGEKIFPEEVEAALMHHPGIEDAVVVGLPHERWGEQVTALVQASDRKLDADEVRQHCRDHLADYKVPKSVVFVESVPRTAVGKLDYKNAKALATQLFNDDR